MRYVIISPVRNEGRFIDRTLRSVTAQRSRPVRWIIVNDGSTDDTEAIVESYASHHPWILLVNKPDRGFTKMGAGVVEAFYEGLKRVDVAYDCLVKLDGDLEFDESYFDNLMGQFNLNSRLGIASGHTYIARHGRFAWEDAPLTHTSGASKVYKKECFQDIGGLVATLGWDHIDEVKARILGWETRSFPEYRIIHLRPIGSKDGILRGNVRHGHISYLVGDHPLYFVMRCIYRLIYPPYIIGGAALFCGYFRAMLRCVPKVVEPEFQRYLRKEQIKERLLNKGFWKPYLTKLRLRKNRIAP